MKLIISAAVLFSSLFSVTYAETTLKEGDFKVGVNVPPRTQVKTFNNRLVISQDGTSNVIFVPKTGAGFSESAKKIAHPVRVHQMRRGGRTVGVAVSH